MLKKWEDTIRQLMSDLTANEKLWTLIRSIDTDIINAQSSEIVDLISLISKILSEFHALFSISPPELKFLCDNEEVMFNGQCTLLSGDELRKIASINKTGIADESLAAIYYDGRPYIALKYTSYSAIRGDETMFVNAYKGVLHQIELLLNVHLYQHYAMAQQAVHNAFFSHKLEPNQCWAEIANRALAHIPQWILRSIPGTPLVQVLLHEKTDKLIVLKGSNKEAKTTQQQLRLDNSITGITLRDLAPETTWKLYDLTDQYYKKFYVSYVDKPSLSELVVKIQYGNKTIGAINFEHHKECAFNTLFVREAIRYAEFIAPIVAALSDRERAYYDNAVNIAYVYNDLLTRIKSAFEHLINQPLGLIGSNIAELNYQVSELVERGVNVVNLTTAIGKIDEAYDDISTKIDTFLKEVPTYVDKGKVSVKQSIDARLESLKRYASKENIEIDTDCDQGLYVHASRFLQEHLYNLINNSFQAVSEQIQKHNISSGSVRVRAELVDVTDETDKLIKMRNVKIIIEDNGGGVAEEYLDRVGKQRFTTKGVVGNGYGVVAAKDYIVMMGGRFSRENIYKNSSRIGFRVQIELPEFDPNLYENTAIQ